MQFQEAKDHNGTIRESHSSFAAPIVLVWKRTIPWLQAILIAKTIRHQFPYKELRNPLTPLVVQNGVQLWILQLNSIRLPWTRKQDCLQNATQDFWMPMGLTNSLSTFQKLIQTCLNGYIFHILLLSLYSITGYSSTIDEPIERIDKVFTGLQEHRPKINRRSANFINVKPVILVIKSLLMVLPQTLRRHLCNKTSCQSTPQPWSRHCSWEWDIVI